MKKYFLHIIVYLLLCSWITSFSYGQATSNSGIIWAADWSPNGKWIAVGGENGLLKIYSKKKYRLYKAFSLVETITAIQWHPDAELLAVSTQGNINHTCLIDLNNDQVIYLEEVSPTGARGLDWNFDGNYLGIADNEGIISIYTKEGKLVRQIKKDNTFSNTGLDWHPSENIFVVLSELVRLYNLDGQLIKAWKHRKEDVLLLCADWHPSGEFLAIGDYGDDVNEPLLQFWTPEGKLLQEINGSKAEYRSIRWTKDGQKIATASDAMRIYSKVGTLLAEAKTKELLWGLDWDKKEKRLIASSEHSRIYVWNKNARLKKLFKF